MSTSSTSSADLRDGMKRPIEAGWVVHTVETIDSTNTFAGRLPAWSAVRADTQSEGRGRIVERRWISDKGGLWLSAVLPCPGPRDRWSILPLAAGWAVASALKEVGRIEPRLRWPNDIMVGNRKLAGLLVERFTDDTAVVGVGLNIFNHPEQAEPSLHGHTVRLADLAPSVYTVDEVAHLILHSLRRMHTLLLGPGFKMIANDLNRTWGKPRPVEITLTGQTRPLEGLFQGIDELGRLRLAIGSDDFRTYDASQVTLLRKLA